MSSKLVGVVMKVENPESLAIWYQDVLGMSIRQHGSDWICEYEKFRQSARVKLVKGTATGSPYKAERNHVYWKIGLALQDVNLARRKIIKLGTEVSDPAQFYEIGYLCHLTDPDGFSIELLQHTLEAKCSYYKVFCSRT